MSDDVPHLRRPSLSQPGIRPRPSLWRQLDLSARASLPAIATALLLMFAAAPLGLPGQAELQAAVALACVYFWSLYRPSAMSPLVTFALGLFADLLSYTPLGVGILTLLMVHGIALRFRRPLVRQGFLLVWLVFAMVSTGGALVEWLLTSILTFTLLPIGPALFQAAIAAGFYPALAVVLTKVHQTLHEPDFA